MYRPAIGFAKAGATVCHHLGIAKYRHPRQYRRRPTLLLGTPEQRNQCEPTGGGQGIHWLELDEDIRVEGILAGRGDQTRRRCSAA